MVDPDASDAGDSPESGGSDAGDSTESRDAGAGDTAEPADGETGGRAPDAEDLESLRERVEAEYDFEDFGPADMARMSAEEWDAVFDPDTWITGTDLLDRVEADLRTRVARREVFARVERVADADGDRVLAYSDEGYAVVFADGTVEGRGTVLRDVEPTVALCSMEDYDPPEPPADADLPSPEEVTAGTGDLGNLMLQVVAGAQILVGLGLLAAWLLTDLSTVVAPAAGFGFVLVGLFLFTVVANARLSDRYRAEAFRDRLRAVGVGTGERPDVPAEPRAAAEGDAETGAAGAAADETDQSEVSDSPD